MLLTAILLVTEPTLVLPLLTTDRKIAPWPEQLVFTPVAGAAIAPRTAGGVGALPAAGLQGALHAAGGAR